MKFNRYVKQILEQTESDNKVNVGYSSGDVCTGDMLFTKLLPVEQVADYFYSPKNFDITKQLTAEMNDPDYMGFPIKPYRWYFPETREEFIERLLTNKPVIFSSVIDESVYPINDDAKDIELFAENNAFFVIHKNINIVNFITRHIFDSMEKSLSG